MNIEEHGDLLEKAYYQHVITNFNNYEILWKLIIGNKGDAEIIPSHDPDLDVTRKKLAQLSYTIFESFVCKQLQEAGRLGLYGG